MINISILYPNQTGIHFDFKYYVEVHMPRLIHLLNAHPGFKGISTERGISSVTSDSPPNYIALCHLQFTTVDTFLEAFLPNAPELQSDIPNYTNAEPVIQINEILIKQNFI